MAKCECLCCGHPVLKKAVEFYCLVWGVLGIIFFIMMFWWMVQYKSSAPRGGAVSGPGTTQQENLNPGY